MLISSEDVLIKTDSFNCKTHSHSELEPYQLPRNKSWVAVVHDFEPDQTCICFCNKRRKSQLVYFTHKGCVVKIVRQFNFLDSACVLIRRWLQHQPPQALKQAVFVAKWFSLWSIFFTVHCSLCVKSRKVVTKRQFKLLKKCFSCELFIRKDCRNCPVYLVKKWGSYRLVKT